MLNLQEDSLPKKKSYLFGIRGPWLANRGVTIFVSHVLVLPTSWRSLIL